MAFSPTTIVLVCCLGAFLIIGIASVTHRMYTGPPGIDPGTEIKRGVNNRPSDQQARLKELRDIHNRQIWERAKDARRELGLPTPNWYPGGEWLFSANASTTQVAINGNSNTLSRSVIEQNSLVARLDNLECPNRMGPAYQAASFTYSREDTTETDEDEYGIPIRQAQSGSATPRIAHHVSRAMYTPAPAPARAATNEEGWELQDLRGVRSSSTYSVIDLGEPLVAPPAQDLTTPPGVYMQGRVNRDRRPSRVHDMVARFEAAQSHF